MTARERAAETVVEATAKPRSRKRRLLRLAIVVVGLLVVLRAGVQLALPAVLDRVVAAHDLTARYENLDLSLFGGDVELWHLEVRARPATDTEAGETEPLLYVEYLKADVDMTALLTGDLVLNRVEIDGLDARIEREADGTLALARHLPQAERAVETRDAEEADTGAAPAVREPAPIDLTPPVRVHAMRLQHARIHLVDASVSPPLDAWLDAQVRVSDIGSPDRDTRLEVYATAPGILDALRIEGRGSASGQHLEAALRGSLSGLRPGSIAAQLGELGVVPRATVLSGDFALEARVDPLAEDDTACSATLAVSDVALRADLEEAFAIDAVAVRVDRLTTAGASIPLVEVRGVRGRAQRTASGALRFAGLELHPVESAEAEIAADEPAPSAAATDAVAPYAWSLARLRLTELALALHDEAVQPAVDLELLADAVEVTDVSPDPARYARPAALTGALRVPGVAAAIRLDGELALFGPRKTLELAVQADGLVPERVAPYLHAAGLESTLTDGRAGARVTATLGTGPDGGLVADASLVDVRLEDGGEELFAIDRVAVDGLHLAGELVHVGAVAIEGTRLALRRDAEGSLHAAGVRTRPEGPAPAPASERAVPADPPSEPAPIAAAAPALRIDHFAWTDNRVSFVDEAVTPPVDLATETLELTLDGLVIGASAAAPARIAGQVAIPGLFEPLGMEGTITASETTLGLSLGIHGRALSADAVRPYLDAAGLESRLAGADLDVDVSGSVAFEDGALAAELAVEGLALTDGGAELVSLGALRIRDAHLDAAGIRVAAIEVERPVLHAARDDEGGLLVMGLRLPPPAPAESAESAGSAESAESAGSAEIPSEAAPAPVPSESPVDRDAAPSTPLSLDRLALTEATLHWTDTALAPAVETAAVLSASLEDLSLGAAPRTAAFAIEVAIADALESFVVSGTLVPDPDDARVSATVAMRGLAVGPLAAYLPPGVRTELADGRLDLTVEAGIAAPEAGGLGAHFTLTDLAFADGAGAEPLLALDRLALVAPRIDPAGGEIVIEEVVLAGLALGARRTPDGALAALGLVVEPARPGAADTPIAAGETVESTPARRSPRRSLGDGPPRVRVQTLDVALERFTFVDEARGAAPIEARLRLHHDEPLVLLDPEPAELPPIALRVSGAIEPAIGAIDAELAIEPYLNQPQLAVAFTARGIEGAGLVSLVPELAGQLDGSELTGGTLSARLGLGLVLDRNQPLDFDLGQGFGLEAELSELALRDGTGAVLVGVDDVYLDAKRIDPATGSVHVRTLSITKPAARARRDAEGALHALGLVLRPAPEPIEAVGSTDAPQPVPVEASARDAAAATPADDAPPAPPGPDFTLDELTVSGLDVLVRDDFVDPPLVVPLVGLDVEVKGFSTRTIAERPVRFSAFLEAGEVTLPERVRHSSLLSGSLAAAASALGGGEEELELEERPLFEEAAVTGRLTLGGHPEGWVKLSMRALELPAFRGEAVQGGVEIGDGVLDAYARLRFRGERGVSVDSRATFTHLSLSEPAGGPIGRYLQLPAPLDSVLFVLKNSQDEHVIPASFDVGREGLSAGQIVTTATATVSKVIAGAIASSPLRITGTFTDLIGLTGGDPPEPPTDDTVTLAYAPGSTLLAPAERDRLEPLVDRLHEDDDLIVILQHELEGGDVARAALLANPPVEDCRALAGRLRQQKAELTRARDELAAEARTLYAIGRTDDARTASERLRSLDHELGQTEDSIDRLYDLLRPGAARRRDQRTRSAALAMAEQRMEMVRQALIELGPPDLAGRLQTRRPRFVTGEGGGGGRVQIVPRRTK